MRPLMFRVHAAIGLACALALVVVGLTGSLLTFHDEIDRGLNPRLFRVAPPAGGSPKLPLDALLEGARLAWPGWRSAAVSLEEWDDPAASLPLRLRKGTEIAEGALDPYTGAPLGLRRDSFAGWVLRLHYTFLLGDRGRVAAFVVAAGLALASLTGLFIHRAAFRALWTAPPGGRGNRPFLSDLHKSLGLYALLFNLTLAFTGGWFSWPTTVRVFSGGKPAGPPPGAADFAPALPASGALAAARAAIPDLRPSLLIFPRASASGGAFLVLGRTPGAPFSHSTCSSVAVDAQTGAVRKASDFRKLAGMDRFRALMVPLHYGNFGGRPVQAAYCLGGLAPAVLSVSGCLLWLSRRRRAAGN